jgi:hypothetical protein
LCVIQSPTENDSLFARLISHQPAVLFSQNEPTTSNQPAVLFSQNKPAPANLEITGRLRFLEMKPRFLFLKNGIKSFSLRHPRRVLSISSFAASSFF